MNSLKSILTMSLVSLLGIGLFNSTSAECPCNRGNGSMQHGAQLAPIAASAYQPAYSPQVQFSQPTYGYGAHGQMSSGYRYQSAANNFSGQIGGYSQPLMMSPYQTQVMPRSGATPPPGTIGQTFKLPSRPVPVDKHPRVGMLDVKIAGAHNVFVHDMNAMRTEDTIDGFKDAKVENIWHFESKPLYPGLDHIYRVQANFKNPDGTERKAEKYVRLIMGRVVELTF